MTYTYSYLFSFFTSDMIFRQCDGTGSWNIPHGRQGLIHVPHNQYHGCWLTDARRKPIYSHIDDLVQPEQFSEPKGSMIAFARILYCTNNPIGRVCYMLNITMADISWGIMQSMDPIWITKCLLHYTSHMYTGSRHIHRSACSCQYLTVLGHRETHYWPYKISLVSAPSSMIYNLARLKVSQVLRNYLKRLKSFHEMLWHFEPQGHIDFGWENAD